jgi:hypothetical protein
LLDSLAVICHRLGWWLEVSTSDRTTGATIKGLEISFLVSTWEWDFWADKTVLK